MNDPTYIDSYYCNCRRVLIPLTAGTAKKLKNYAFYNVLVVELILRQLTRLKPFGDSLASERASFQTWETSMRNLPRMRIYLSLSIEIIETLDEVVETMFELWGQNTDSLRRRFTAYLISRGLLWRSLDESEVSK